MVYVEYDIKSIFRPAWRRKRPPPADDQETKFNERLKPYILGLRKHYAKIPVAEACKLRSGHAISFYLYSGRGTRLTNADGR